jgi:hypothetical protein
MSFNFLGLPAEIRMQIYDLLLVSRLSLEKHPQYAHWADAAPNWIVRKTSQKKISLNVTLYVKTPIRTVEAGILQTCKQVYREANIILYSRNLFVITDPKQMYYLLTHSGFENFMAIKLLEFWVKRDADLDPWLRLLYKLSLTDEAPQLTSLEVGFDSSELRWNNQWRKSLGDNVLFARSLGKIKGLKRMKITGFFGKNWPDYLSAKMGFPVEVQICVYAEVDDEDTTPNVQWLRTRNEKYVRNFTAFQQATENVFP